MGYRILYHHRIRADDGQAVHVRELIGALRRRGHEVLEVALVPKASDTKPRANDAGRSASGGEPSRSFWQRLSLPRAAVEVMEVVYNRTGRRMVREAARTFRPDFVYERHALHCRVGLDAARELGVPLLLEVNSPMTREMERLGALKLPGRARRTEREVLGGADRVLAVTRVLGDILIEDGARADRICVIPNGAQPDRYTDVEREAGRAIRGQLGVGDGAFALGFVGYARPWHRLDLVLDIMERPGFEDLHLIVVGHGPAIDELAPRWSGGGRLFGRVHALGAVPGELVPAHVCAFDAALIPAINAYASPLKLFDSLAAAVPTIAPRQPNLLEIIGHGDNGLLFEPENADSLADAMGTLLNDRDGAHALGHRGRRSLEERRLTWDANADRVIDAFEGLRATQEAVS